MHASISHHAGIGGATDRVADAAWQLTAALSRAPGFVSYVLLEVGGSQLVSVSVFESRPELEAADRMIGAWMAEHLPAGHEILSALETGEIVLQYGM